MIAKYRQKALVSCINMLLLTKDAEQSVALVLPPKSNSQSQFQINANYTVFLHYYTTCTIARVRSCALLLFLRFLCNMHKKFSLTTYLHFLGGRRVYKQLSNSHISI